MYPLIRPVLFKLAPETAHDLSMSSLSSIAGNAFLTAMVRKHYADKIPQLPVKLMGLDFKHPIGLAAGLDKNARAFKAFSALGFSAVELGTVTPKPQSGNAKPRMFRLVQDRAIINRMGFNSSGLEPFLRNISTDESAIAGINIGKNKLTDNAMAVNDYSIALNAVYQQADYITINISSPNTSSLRDLQSEEPLDQLLTALKQEQLKLSKEHGKYKPIALKIAPDLDSDEIKVISHLLIKHQFDALIATNTTISRPDSLQSKEANEAGGLSGAPLKLKSTETIADFYQHLKGKIPIIGVGGIESSDDAWQKLLAGADYLQIYSGLIYHGPTMIKTIVTELQEKITQLGYSDLTTALKDLRS
ncbi:MAG: quinone-dependent dihydroorotate dehydrogenase [Arenicella sp.]